MSRSDADPVSLDDLFAIYVALWRTASTEGAFVRYESGGARSEAGWFHPRDEFAGPEIVIVRPFYGNQTEPSDSRTDGQPVDLLGELITLAHEYGHFRSWSDDRPRWDAYYAALLRREQVFDAAVGDGAARWLEVARLVSSPEKQLILEEEARAWRTGRAHVPVGLLAEYDLRATAGVEAHRARLFAAPDASARDPRRRLLRPPTHRALRAETEQRVVVVVVVEHGAVTARDLAPPIDVRPQERHAHVRAALELAEDLHGLDQLRFAKVRRGERDVDHLAVDARPAVQGGLNRGRIAGRTRAARVGIAAGRMSSISLSPPSMSRPARDVEHHHQARG